MQNEGEMIQSTEQSYCLPTCQFICVKSENPPIHSKPKTKSFEKIPIRKPLKRVLSKQSNDIDMKIDVREDKKPLQQRKYFNQMSNQQLSNSKQNCVDYGILAKFMKNIGEENIKISIGNSSFNDNTIEEEKTNEQCYNILCQPKKASKIKKNWFKEFIQKKDSKHDSNSSNSIEIISTNTPGPGNYKLCHQVLSQNEKIKYFGGEERFIDQRPITSKIDYYLPKKVKKNSYNQKIISFGSLKKNHRSSIKKIQYCDWYRPHCCENRKAIEKQLKKKIKHQDPQFLSKQKRFKEEKKYYSGPDYYNKPSKKNKILSKFSTSVKKNLENCQADQRDYLAQTSNTMKNDVENNIRKKSPKIIKNEHNLTGQTYKDMENYLKSCIPDQVRKNTGKIQRRIKLPDYPHHQNENKISTPSPTHYRMQNQWGRPSFNVKISCRR